MLVLIATVTGFSISLILSVVYGKLINQRPLVTWGVTALVLPSRWSLYAFIDGWMLSLYRRAARPASRSCCSACSTST